MTVIVVSGTGTEIGKTVVTAALAAAARAHGRTVAVLKPAQTGLAHGEPGDADEVVRLAGDAVTGVELARFPEPLAPATAARRAGLPPVRPHDVATAAASSPSSTTRGSSKAPAASWSASTTTAPPSPTPPACSKRPYSSSPRPPSGRSTRPR